jgi:hypothetical protein
VWRRPGWSVELEQHGQFHYRTDDHPEYTDDQRHDP